MHPVTANRRTFPAWFRRAGTAACATALALVLSACGGNDADTAPPAVVAAADTFTVSAGQTVQLLANDTVGGVAATAGAAGNVTFTLTSAALPTGVTVTNGAVTVASTAVPGVVSLTYRICQTGSTTNCANGTAQITVPAPPIVAVADSFNLAGGQSGDVLANDTLGGVPATAASVTANATGTLPTGITLSPAGLVTVGGTAVAGSYNIAYRICQTVALTNCASSTVSVMVPSLGTITGRVVDSATALGLEGVRVSVGALSTTTDGAGSFSLGNLAPSDRVNVLFTADTHAETVRIAAVRATASTDVQARMVRVAATADVDVAAGGSVTVAGSSARVDLPAAGVQRADGSVPTGNMRVRVTPIDPASDTAVMPGDFTTLVGSTPTLIESFGAMNVTLADSAGVPLNLRAGQTATLRIPLASRSTTIPPTIPLFYFDTATGRWVQEGTATLAGTGANRYYEGTVSHFTTWNADQVMNTVRVTGCVADANGVRVAGAAVYSDGITYSGTSSATTDAQGSFSIPIRISSEATLTALGGGLLSNTLRVGPYASDTQVTACLALGESGAGVTMKLTWGARPTDLDSHLYTPNGSHVYYGSQGSLVSVPFANLDVDDTSSYGPEVVTVVKLMVGTYKYAINNYSGQNAGLFSAASARVELSIPGRAVELFTPPATGETTSTNWWSLFEFDVDAQCNITVRRTGTLTTTQPATAASGTPVYCTRP